MKKVDHGGFYGGLFSLTTLLTASIFLCFLLQPSTAYVDLTFENFTIFALTQNSPLNNTIHFDLKLRNQDVLPIYYDALNVTFYYKSKVTQFPIGNVTFAPFYQKMYGDDNRACNFEATGVKWENATVSHATFRVQVATSLTFGLEAPSTRRMTKVSNSKGGPSPKIRTPSPNKKPKRKSKSKRQRYVVIADLKVNDKGNLANKGVKLKSNARRNIKGGFEMLGILLSILIFLHSW